MGAAWPCSPPWDSLSRSASTRRPSSRTSCSKQAVSERSVKASKPKANQTESNRIELNRIESNRTKSSNERGKDEESWGVRVRVWCVVAGDLLLGGCNGDVIEVFFVFFLRGLVAK